MKSRVRGKGAPTARVPVYRTEDHRAGLMSSTRTNCASGRSRPRPSSSQPNTGRRTLSRAGIRHLRRWSSCIRKPPACWRGRRYSRGSPGGTGSTSRIYAPDTIGDVGRSELDDFDVYPKKGGDFSAWLGGLYAELGITRADVIGGSMGGWVAMHSAISAPDCVRKLAARADGPSLLAHGPHAAGADDVPGASPD